MDLRLAVSLAGVLGICCVHLWMARLHFLHRGKGWLAFSNGAAAAYVFTYMLPKLAYKQIILDGAVPAVGLLGYLQHHAYLVALAGFIAYFGISRSSAQIQAEAPVWGRLLHPLETVHLLGVAAYSFLVGHLIADHQPPDSVVPLAILCAAMTLHFLGSDHVEYERYGAHYERSIRWLLASATLGGWSLGILTALRPTTVALWFAFLSGSIIVGVFEEELPGDADGRFLPFLGGALCFALLSVGLE